jgi:hypothetical protein
MPPFEADDFAAINAGMRELRCEAPGESTSIWWCIDCRRTVGEHEILWRTVDAYHRHDESKGGCGCFVVLSCDTCGNAGWVPSGNPWAPWYECSDCENPAELPCP